MFVRSADNVIWHTWWDGTQWYVWQPSRASVASNPGAVASGPNLIDVFVLGTTSNVLHEYYGYT